MGSSVRQTTVGSLSETRETPTSLHNDVSVRSLFRSSFISCYENIPRDEWYNMLNAFENTRGRVNFVSKDEIEAQLREFITTCNSLRTRTLSDIARLETILSKEDATRLFAMEAIYVSDQRKLLAFSNETDTFIHVNAISNGFVTSSSMFAAPHSCLARFMADMPVEYFREKFKPSDGNYIRGELSEELSKYIWALDEDVIHVQFRSHVPMTHPSFTGINVVFSNNRDVDGDELCLAACNDGTVKWLHQSECGNGNHIWTVHLFDRPSKEMVHLSQRLRRRG